MPTEQTLKEFECLSEMAEFVSNTEEMESLKAKSQELYGNRSITVNYLELKLTTKIKKRN